MIAVILFSINTQGLLELSSVVKLLSNETLIQKGDGFLSHDDVIGVYQNGYWESRVSSKYNRTSYESLIIEKDLIGRGKNWYSHSRMDNLVKCLSGTQFELYICEMGLTPAIIKVGKAEILVAPYFKR